MGSFFAPQLRVDDLSSEDVRLLQISLGDNAVSDRAWAEWRASVDFDVLTTGCLLVPAAFYSLGRMGDQQAGAVFERMKGAYRKNWLLTQLLQERALPLLDMISAAKLECVLGDDLALALSYYDNPGMRPIYEVSLYCAAPDKDRLAKLLAETDLKPVRKHCWQLTDQALLRVRSLDPSAATTEVKGGATLPIPVLDPTAQFWTTFKAARPQTILRFLDLGIVVRDYGEQIDWQQISQCASADNMKVSLQEVLSFYSETLGLVLSSEADGMMLQEHKISGSITAARRARAFASTFRNRVRARAY